MERGEITVPVTLDETAFRRFTLYDLLIVRRSWVRPVLFAAIMLAFAAAALLLRREQSGLIAAVMAVIGLSLPLVWTGSIVSQVNLQAKKLHLRPPRHVYTLTFTDRGVLMRHASKKEDVSMPWESIHMIRRYRGDYYFYRSPSQAFILPAAQADSSGPELREMLNR